MFYSHEVLTSRKYGVATVWLVATLGSKSSLKRINRKQILDVDVAKACQTIVDPVAPMALRLQGNLLYGVSRVYLQQCGYVLSDAQNTHNAMLMLLRTVKNHALDPDAGKARPDQLMLQDDPSFLPEFALPPLELLADLDARLNLDVSRSGDSQSLTPLGSQRSQSSSQVGALGGLVLPTSSPDHPGCFSLGGDNDAVDLGGADDNIVLEDPVFGFDDDGMLFEGPPAEKVAGTPAAQSGAAMLSDAGASAKVRREHEEGRMGGVQIPGDLMDLDLPVLGSDLPDGEAFPSASKDQGSDQIEVIHSTSTASAPMRKKRRTARALPIDSRMELRNKDLSDWNANYLQNMNTIIKSKKHARVAQGAKKSAEYFVWGSGIGDFSHHSTNNSIPTPFAMFTGDALFELATGVSRAKVVGKKHDRDSGIDDETQAESRRVRQKIREPDDADMPRGLDDDDGFTMPPGDDVELPREAGTALDDQNIFSSMPWNISASKHGSSAIPRSARLGVLDQGRPGSRMVSASPLHGRGAPLRLEALGSLDSDGDVGMGGDEYALPGPSSPPTVIGSPRKTSTRFTDALGAEGENFLYFVTGAIDEKRQRDFADAHGDAITFQELLPPTQNSKMIACQGLMMVLTLGTKGMLDVQQPEDFGDIGLKLTEKAKTSQVVDISDGEEEEGSGGDGEVEQAGQSDEQLAAGHAAGEEDERDSLYDD